MSSKTVVLRVTDEEAACLERLRRELAAQSPGATVTINDAIRHVVRHAMSAARSQRR